TWIRRFEIPSLLFLGALGLSAALLSFEFHLLEANLYDFRMARGTKPTPSSEIVVITLDDPTAKALGEHLPLDLKAHADFLSAIEKAQPRAVGYLVNFNHVHQT